MSQEKSNLFLREEEEEYSPNGKGEKDQSGMVMVEREDPITKKKVKIPKELDIFLGHIISSTRKSAEEKYKPVIDALEKDKAELSEVRNELEKMREASMTAEERAQKNAEKRIREFEGTLKKYEEESIKWRNLFNQSIIKNEIYGAFGDIRLYNPEQVAALFAQEGRARVEEKVDADGKPTGEYETRVTIDIINEKGEVQTIEGTPKQLFPKWISQERNLHHQVNNLPSGAGSKGNVGKGRIDYSQLSPVERLRKARERV